LSGRDTLISSNLPFVIISITFLPWKISSEKVSKLRSIAELRAFDSIKQKIPFLPSFQHGRNVELPAGQDDGRGQPKRSGAGGCRHTGPQRGRRRRYHNGRHLQEHCGHHYTGHHDNQVREHRLINRRAAAAIQALNAAGGGDTTTAAIYRNIVDTTTQAIMTTR
jgi:hypothetical protein